MPNIKILAQAVLKISSWQGFSIAIIVESRKGHKLVNIFTEFALKLIRSFKH